MPEYFFRRESDRRFVPTERTRGPWDPRSMHGRVIAGLLAHVIEVEHGDPALQVTRLTVDMFRVAPMLPVEVSSRRVRDGNRIRVVDASMVADGVEVARASAVMLRRAEQPPGEVWRPEPWAAPPPEALPAPEWAGREGFVPMWETRPADPSGGRRPRRVWVREVVDFLEGEPASPLVRAAQAADYVNPLANSSDLGLNFVNADLTLYLHRDPRGEWIGLDVASHQSDEGVAVGECLLYDVEGPVGHSVLCAVANRRS
jgi:acyl-CoA thioesterase